MLDADSLLSDYLICLCMMHGTYPQLYMYKDKDQSHKTRDLVVAAIYLVRLVHVSTQCYTTYYITSLSTLKHAGLWSLSFKPGNTLVLCVKMLNLELSTLCLTV